MTLDPEPSLKRYRIGLPSNYYFERVEPDVERAVRAAVEKLRGLGAEILDVEIPEIEDFTVLSRLILLPEATAVHRQRLKDRRADIGPDVLALLDQGQFVLAADYLDAQRRRRQLIETLRGVLDQVDVIVTPATPNTAPKIGETTVEIGGQKEDARLAATRFVRALNMAGVPALSVPCGVDSKGLPIGLQIFGRAFDEATVLLVGHAYETVSGWNRRRPPL